jgi:glycosyltransferase involved in cell wall biosynthesis
VTGLTLEASIPDRVVPAQSTSHLRGKRILFVVGYIPGKLGSFERFMEAFAQQCIERGAHFAFVFRGEPGADVAQKFEAAGAKIHVIPMRSRLDWRFVRKLFALMRAERIDVLHSNFDLANFATSLVALGTRVPTYIWHQHNFMGQPFSLARWTFVKVLNRVVTRVLCVTDSMRLHLIGKGMATDKVSRLYIGPDLAQYDAPQASLSIDVREEFGFPEHALILTCVGVALPEKGQLHLLKAFAAISGKFPDARLLLVGAQHGRYAPALQAAAVQLAITDKVRITPIRSDVARILHASDVAVVTPLQEVSLLAIMESMAAGKPVIATRVGGIPEVVTHRDTGLLVPPADVGALAKALADLLGNTWMRVRMGKAGRRAVEERFNTDAAVGRLLEVYERLTAK